MPQISIALVSVAVLLLLSFNLWRRRKDSPALWPFLVLAILAAGQGIMVDLRWGHGVDSLRIPQALVAAALPLLAWLAFQHAAIGEQILQRRKLLHALPIFAVGLAFLVFPDAIDLILIATSFFYGVRFLRLGWSGEAAFDHTALERVFDMRRAVWLMAFTLLSSALVDALVVADFAGKGGQHAPMLIAFGNVVWLLALGFSLAVGSRVLPEDGDSEVQETIPPADVEDHRVVELVQQLLNTSKLAMEPELTLSRLARRACLPARSVSNAINRVHGKNVSQFINDIRIAEACRLLDSTGMPVTQVIYSCGFQTKSNFNREFLRVTGKTPSDWRKLPKMRSSVAR